MAQTSKLFILILVCTFLAACGNSVSDEVGPTDNGAKELTTKVIDLSLNEEQISMRQDSMTRAGSSVGKKYYGINIYEKSGKKYNKYAYGVFDESATISAIMTEGKKYRIEVMEFKNDEDTLYHEGNKFYHPLMINGSTPSTLTNTFTYDNTANLSGIKDGKSKVGKEASDTTWYVRAFRYYGIADNFDPATSDKLTVNVRRTVFGIHFIITPPAYGTVKFRFLRNHFITVNAGDETYDHESIYSFNMLDQANVDGYKAEIPLSVTWTSEDKTIHEESIDLPITRNVVTTVKINFEGPTPVESTIEEENTEMGSESVNWTVTTNKNE